MKLLLTICNVKWNIERSGWRPANSQAIVERANFEAERNLSKENDGNKDEPDQTENNV